jgi:hypothetical protein
MSDSTSILDLPTDPVGGGNISNGISLTATESGQQSAPQLAGLSLDQSTINQIVNGLQQASVNGGTQLSSRDIPIMTTGHSNDPHVLPNYVPPPPQGQNADYIQNYEQASDIINTYNKQLQNTNSLDDMYNEIQTPLLLAVLYFLFQLPFFRKFLFTYIPFLFSTDGNLNINGYLFTSILFGLVFYIFNKMSLYFNAF